jgi:hypothetical protein
MGRRDYITYGLVIMDRSSLQTGTGPDFAMPHFLDKHVHCGPLLSSYAHICMGTVRAYMQKGYAINFFTHAFCFSIFVFMYKTNNKYTYLLLINKYYYR